MNLIKIADVYTTNQENRVKMKKLFESNGYVTAYQSDTSLVLMEEMEENSTSDEEG